MPRALFQVACYNTETDKIECLSWVIAANPQEAQIKAIEEWSAGGTWPQDITEQRKRVPLPLPQIVIEQSGKIDAGGSSSLSRVMAEKSRSPLLVK